MEKLRELVARVFGVDIKKINDEFSRSSVEWDSFNHLLLVSEIEKEMGITLTIQDTEKIKTFGDLRKLLSKVNKKNE